MNGSTLWRRQWSHTNAYSQTVSFNSAASHNNKLLALSFWTQSIPLPSIQVAVFLTVWCAPTIAIFINIDHLLSVQIHFFSAPYCQSNSQTINCKEDNYANKTSSCQSWICLLFVLVFCFCLFLRCVFLILIVHVNYFLFYCVLCIFVGMRRWVAGGNANWATHTIYFCAVSLIIICMENAHHIISISIVDVFTTRSDEIVWDGWVISVKIVENFFFFFHSIFNLESKFCVDDACTYVLCMLYIVHISTYN